MHSTPKPNRNMRKENLKTLTQAKSDCRTFAIACLLVSFLIGILNEHDKYTKVIQFGLAISAFYGILYFILKKQIKNTKP
jgi:type III secretory pathway component EscT